MNITESCEVLPDADTFVVASFAGGVEDYEIWWDKNGTAIDSVEGRDEVDHVYSRANVDGPGVYTVHGVDSMYATAKGSVTVTAPKLTIVEQPVGGTIPRDGYSTIYVELAEEETIYLPYLYMLYRNGEHYLQYSAPRLSGSFSIWYPGTYYIRIVDNKGRSADSDAVTFQNEVFHIKNQTGSGTITKPGDTVKLFVEAEGGKEPYTYLWSYKRYNTRYKVGEARTYTADKPGEYLCRVYDADGEMIHSEPIMVGYTGDTPIITSQPTGGILKDGGSVYLSCDAVTGSGGELRFDWERTATGVRPAWRNAARSGASYRSWDATVVGSYRCKVTDTKTGKYTYTQVAIVGESLVFGSVEASNFAYGSTPIKVTVTGGVGPYSVKVYLKYPYWTGEKTEYKNVLYSSFTVDNLEELAQHTIYLDDLVKYLAVSSDGESHYVNDIARYYIEITDALGNKVTSEYTPRAN